MLNMNEAERQKNFDPIPDGSFLKLMLQFKGGGGSFPGCEKDDEGMFKLAKDPGKDTVMLECEFTVLTPGPFQHRKWTEYWVVFGGAVDEKGSSKGWNFTKQRIRAMIESASNIRPDDESPEAKAGRMVPNFSALDECPFYAKIRIEEGEDYFDAETQANKKGFDKNVIDRIVTPDMEEYAPLVRGEAVAPKPSGRRAAKPADAAGGAGGAGAPRWKQGGTGGAQAQPALPLATEAPKTETGATPAGGPKWLRKS